MFLIGHELPQVLNIAAGRPRMLLSPQACMRNSKRQLRAATTRAARQSLI